MENLGQVTGLNLIKKILRHINLLLFIGCFAIFLPIMQAYAAQADEAMVRVYPTVDYGRGAKSELIHRGEYLVRAGDCISCHTARNGKAFAGGVPFKTLFGIFYSHNITPDPETGIGRWTLEQFIKSMQQGIRPDGQPHFPVYPFMQFTHIYQQDLIAIKAYLDAVPKAYQRNRKNDVPWPFSWRFSQWFWCFLFFKSGEFKPDTKYSAKWNRGAYLVRGLGHCGMCHTPINLLGAPKHKYFMVGSDVSGMYAPDITGHRLKRYAIADIVNVFYKDYILGGDSARVVGPMYEVNHNSLRYLNRSDLESIAIYLQTISSQHPPTKKIIKSAGHGKSVYKNNGLAKTPMKTLIKTGKIAYERHCAVCHQSNGAGMPPVVRTLHGSPIVTGDILKHIELVLYGVKGTAMRAFCTQLSDEQLAAIINYQRHSWGNQDKKKYGQKAPGRVTSEQIKAVRDKHGNKHIR